MKAIKVCRNCGERGHERATCSKPEAEKRFRENETDAVNSIVSLLLEKVPRDRWVRALYDSLALAQRTEGKAERDQLENAFEKLSH